MIPGTTTASVRYRVDFCDNRTYWDFVSDIPLIVLEFSGMANIVFEVPICRLSYRMFPYIGYRVGCSNLMVIVWDMGAILLSLVRGIPEDRQTDRPSAACKAKQKY